MVPTRTIDVHPTDTLMRKHARTEQVLDALESYASALKYAAKPDDLSLFVTFAREFADGVHHGKEEQILLRAMVDAGHRSDAGPVAVFRREHEHGRGLVGTLAEMASRASAWIRDDVATVREVAHEYVALLRRHIEKEDAVLFPMPLRHRRIRHHALWPTFSQPPYTDRNTPGRCRPRVVQPSRLRLRSLGRRRLAVAPLARSVRLAPVRTVAYHFLATGTGAIARCPRCPAQRTDARTETVNALVCSHAVVATWVGRTDGMGLAGVALGET
jgi:hemerythrin-like domain-containing protein